MMRGVKNIGLYLFSHHLLGVMLLAEWDSKSSIVVSSVMTGSRCPMYSPLLKVMCLLV